jgi:uncharacterized paraquat-inducible protein A
MPDYKTNFCAECGSLLDIVGVKDRKVIDCRICGNSVARKEVVSKKIVTTRTIHVDKGYACSILYFMLYYSVSLPFNPLILLPLYYPKFFSFMLHLFYNSPLILN